MSVSNASPPLSPTLTALRGATASPPLAQPSGIPNVSGLTNAGLSADTVTTGKSAPPRFGANPTSETSGTAGSKESAASSEKSGGFFTKARKLLQAGTIGTGVALASNMVTIPSALALGVVGCIPGLHFLWGAAIGVALLGPIAAGLLAGYGGWKI